MPSWLDLDIIVPVVATVIVVCVGVLVVCVAITRRKQQPMMPPGPTKRHQRTAATKNLILQRLIIICSQINTKNVFLPLVFSPFAEEYAQYYGQMNTMNGRMMTIKAQQGGQQHDGLPYEDMG